MSSKTLVIATSNPGKAAEIQSLLSPLKWEVILPPKKMDFSAVETASTFLENALQKARRASHEFNLPALADDSGLCVEALGGKPGLLSSRFGGEKASDETNRALLLKKLEHVPLEERIAYFYSAAVFLKTWDDPLPLIGEGRWEGSIALEPKGSNGFGYDPIFYVPPHHCTAAELSSDEKNRISHRGQALRALIVKMRSM